MLLPNNTLYTTMRTINTSSGIGILFPDGHLERLQIKKDTLLDALGSNASWSGDERITVVNAQGNYFVATERINKTKMDHLRENGCRVLLVQHERSDPNIKSTKWVKERANILPISEPDVEETLLINSDGKVCEGLSSNFFASYGDVSIWYTAPESMVLPGTMRGAIIEALGCLGLELKLEAPDIEKVKSAFITSTSRIILPISDFNGTKLTVSSVLIEQILKTLQDDIFPKRVLELSH